MKKRIHQVEITESSILNFYTDLTREIDLARMMGLQTGQVAGCMEAGSTPRHAMNFGGTESPAQKNRIRGRCTQHATKDERNLVACRRCRGIFLQKELYIHGVEDTN